MAEYGTQADDSGQQLWKAEVIMGEKDKGKPLDYVKGNGNHSGLDIASTEDVYCAGVAIAVFPDIFT